MPCALASLPKVLEGDIFGLRFSFHVGVIMIFDSAPDSIKSSFSESAA